MFFLAAKRTAVNSTMANLNAMSFYSFFYGHTTDEVFDDTITKGYTLPTHDIYRKTIFKD